MSNDPRGDLIGLNKWGRMLARARSVEVVKNLRDRAEAARQYAKSAKLGLEPQNTAAALRLRAERKVGEMLAALKLHGGQRKSKSTDVTLKKLNLRDLGVSPMQSVRWQQMAAVPRQEFEAYLREAARQGQEISAAGLYRFAAPRPSGKSRPRRGAGRPRKPLPSYVIQEARDHLALLSRLLAPVCKSERPQLEQCEREHVARLLENIAELLKTLASYPSE